MKGRSLRQGDVLVGGALSAHARESVGRSLSEKLRPVYSRSVALRILPGPQCSLFSEQSLELLTTDSYRLTGQSDRMGYRLEGPALTHAGGGRWISDGTATGALQIPENGRPILLMADRHTTGGYPKVAVVISADLHLAGQLLPGDTVTFRTTTLSEALIVLGVQGKELDDTLSPHREPSPQTG
jgi:antagonist of KipI